MTDPVKVSFRGQLKGEVGEFIEKVGMACVETTNAIVELIVELSHYDEEGKQLYPKVMVCDSLTDTLALLQGAAPLEIGRGPKCSNTAKQALKKCAPLAQRGWSIYVERYPNEFRYGVFREPELPTAVDIRRTLADSPKEATRAILAWQLAERAVELVGVGNRRLHLHLSAASIEEASPSAATEAFFRAAVRDAPEEVRESLRSYISSVIGRALLQAHGTLLIVVHKDKGLPTSLADDGILLVQPINLADLVRTFLDQRDQDVSSMLALTAYGSLLEGMLGCDGITVLRSDGAIVGYNFFVKRASSEKAPESELLGGARRRAFTSLCSSVDRGEILCAFIRSSSGSCDHREGASL